LFTVGGGIDMVLSALKELFAGVDFISIDAVLTWPLFSFEGAFTGLLVSVLTWPFFSFEGAFTGLSVSLLT
jgi:hypothetical protein